MDSIMIVMQAVSALAGEVDKRNIKLRDQFGVVEQTFSANASNWQSQSFALSRDGLAAIRKNFYQPRFDVLYNLVQYLLKVVVDGYFAIEEKNRREIDGFINGLPYGGIIQDAIKKDPRSMKENPNGNVATIGKDWNNIVFNWTNEPGGRSSYAYNKVLDQFNVASNFRYTPDGDTYCNMFVWDATKAMGCEIPHYYNPYTGDKTDSRVDGEYLEMHANRMCEWLDQYGEKNGWHHITAQEAQARANEGNPVVAAGYNPGGIGHVQMVRPLMDGDVYNDSRGPAVAQAGGTNVNYGYSKDYMGDLNVEYYYHD